MAKKRMFSMSIVDSDAFLDMPLSTQCLYFHLNMRADDDGFVANPKRIQRLIGAGDDDLKLLLAKRFILSFPDGIIVIKHWRINNNIKSDRHTPTVFQEELKLLGVKDNKAYTLSGNKQLSEINYNGDIWDTNGFQNGDKMSPSGFRDVSIDGDILETSEFRNDSTNGTTDLGLGLDSELGLVEENLPPTPQGESEGEKKEKKKRERAPFVPPTPEEVQAYCDERGNGISGEAFVAFYASKGWKVGASKMVSWKHAIVTWETKRGFKYEKPKEPENKQNSKYDNYE